MSTHVRHVKKGDQVVALSGSFSGKSGKVVEVKQSKGLVKVEGLGLVKKHLKPSQGNPKGGIVDQLRWIPSSKFQVCNESAQGLGRAAFLIEGSGKNSEKKRIFKKSKSKKKA